MNQSKTIPKKTATSQKVEQETIKPSEPRHKSQVIECTSLFKNGESFEFNVFADTRVIVNPQWLPSVPMAVDEDC